MLLNFDHKKVFKHLFSPSFIVPVYALFFALVFYGLTLFPFEWSWGHVRLSAWRMLIGFSNALLIFLCLANSQWLFALGMPTLLLASSLAAYLRLQMGVVVDTHVIGTLFEADRTEVRTFLTIDIWQLMGFATLIGFSLSWLYVRRCWQRRPWQTHALQAYGVVALLVTLLFASRLLKLELENVWLGVCAASLVGAWRVSQLHKHTPAAYVGLVIMLAPALSNPSQSATFLPSNLIFATASHLAGLKFVAEARANRIDIAALPNAVTDIADETMVTVLVIGESARADHFGFNGYARPTTPKLSATADLVSFAQVKSCTAATRTSVPCLMTRATKNDLSVTLSERSLISVFRHFGFDTAWLSTNQIYGRHDTPITAVADEAAIHQFLTPLNELSHETFDGALIEPLQQFLARPAPRKLIVLHQRGSHWHYHDRYPSEFRQFTPTCEGNTPPYLCDLGKLKNGYDNSILYTDHVLSEVIAQLANHKALLLYTSDHGQSLGEDGFYTHGSPERFEQRHVPMVWWASDHFKQAHPAILKTLASKRLQPVSHDHVFHSLLGCSGFHGAIIDEKLNLCAQ